LPVGAEVISDQGVHFRVWAPKRREVAVVIEGDPQPVKLTRDDQGYFAGLAPNAKAGSLYRYRLDDVNYLYPDPVSRFQPQGPHGPSQVVDPNAFKWTDGDWRGVTAHGQVLYEMHIGTFTPEGTWEAATRELAGLKDLGVTCLEVMPVAEFAGRFGWGYDGVDQFAPFHHYGSPDAFRAFVNRAHNLGIGVILDLVYNHLGPDGNYVKEYSDDYFNAEHATDWGEALNFDGHNSAPVREFFVSNALYWVTEFHMDGFRYDATQAIVDTSPKHLLAEITEKVRAATGKRSIYLINENEPQNTQLVRPIAGGGYGMDALWNDDFHHSAMVALSGRSESYYTDHPGTAQEFISSAKWGYLYQGQRYKNQKKRRGSPALDLPPTAFVHFLQNHDQVANSGRGYRAHQIASPGQWKAMTALMLLMPQTPMLFQGQEFAASSTFHYFADHNPDLAKLVAAGRAKELAQFPSVATDAMQPYLLDPADEQTFLKSKLDPADRPKPFHQQMFQFHKDLLALRRSEAAFRRVQRRGDIDGAVLGHDAFVLRFFGEGHDDRLLIVNLGNDLTLDIAPEPLLAPPAGQRWSLVWSSEHPQYGGSGTPAPDTEQEGWFILGRCTVVLRPLPEDQATVSTRIKHAGSAQAPKRKSESGEGK
jgi:maltooligosyltrehalose trehalohydrolase